MKELSWICNWRADVVVVLLSVSFVLMTSESDRVFFLLLDKGIGVVFSCVAFFLYRYWSARGLLDELDESEE